MLALQAASARTHLAAHGSAFCPIHVVKVDAALAGGECGDQTQISESMNFCRHTPVVKQQTGLTKVSDSNAYPDRFLCLIFFSKAAKTAEGRFLIRMRQWIPETQVLTDVESVNH